MAIKGRSTQSIANCYPPWSSIRQDQQSFGFQILNSFGLTLDNLKKQLEDIRLNYYLPTARVSDIDLFYPLELSANYEWVKEDSDLTNLLYTPPTVSGEVNGINYEVTVASENNVESFWYDSLPTRLSLEQTITGDHLLASGYANQSPLLPLVTSGILPYPNQLTIQIEDGTSYLALSDDNILRRGVLQVEGTTRAGIGITEEFALLYDETFKTLHEYQSIDEVRIFGAEPADEVFVTVKAGAFNMDDYALEYILDNSSDVDQAELPLFWSLGVSTASGYQTLDLAKYIVNSIELRLEGYTDKEIILQQELVASGVDMAIEPRTDRVWVAGSGILYVYDARMPYPNCASLRGKNYDAYSVMEVSSEFVVVGEDVEIDYLWKRPVTGLVAHRTWVEMPDGSKKSLEDGVEVTYHADSTSWIYGEPRDRHIKPSEIYTLGQRGQYVFNLEVRYTDGTTSLDKRIITAISKTPLATYETFSLGIAESITGIDFDSEYKLWLLGESGTKYQINLHYDNMIVDFTKKIIYLHEPYDRVRILGVN